MKLTSEDLKSVLKSVIEEALEPVKEDLQGLKTDVQGLKTGQAELQQITSALRSGQEITHAKLEALTIDVRRAEGGLVRIEKKLDELESETHGDIRFLNHRIADVELDVEKIKGK